MFEFSFLAFLGALFAEVVLEMLAPQHDLHKNCYA